MHGKSNKKKKKVEKRFALVNGLMNLQGYIKCGVFLDYLKVC